MSRLKRAVGYCLTSGCEDIHKGVFLMNQSQDFYCPRCRCIGLCVPETTKALNDLPVFREVRVEFDYNPTTGHHQGLAVVTDTSIKVEANVFYIYSPLIRTDKRALKIAEAVLATLQREEWVPKEDKGIPTHAEMVMDLDKPRIDFASDCLKLSQTLEKSSLAREKSCPSTPA